MGSHQWVEQCSYCGFEEMNVSSYNSLDFEATCPICGYARWTEENVPDNQDVDLAKQALGKMNTQEKERMVELYSEDNLPFIVRLKGRSK